MQSRHRLVGDVFFRDRAEPEVLVVARSSTSPVFHTLCAGNKVAIFEAKPPAYPTSFRLPYSDDVFDYVAMDDVFSTDWNIAGALQEAKRVTRPGGIIAGCERGPMSLTRPALGELVSSIMSSYQHLKANDGYAFRLQEPPLPGLSVGYFCDGRANETLERAAQEVVKVADQVVVVDTAWPRGLRRWGPLDRGITDRLGAEVYRKSWDDNAAAAANAVRQKARHEWVCIMDDDCRVDRQTAYAIRRITNEVGPEKLTVQMQHRITSPSWETDDTIRWDMQPPKIFRNRWWIFFTGVVHESITSSLQLVDGLGDYNVPVPKHWGHYVHLDCRAGQTREEKRRIWERMKEKGRPT